MVCPSIIKYGSDYPVVDIVSIQMTTPDHTIHLVTSSDQHSLLEMSSDQHSLLETSSDQCILTLIPNRLAVQSYISL